MPFVIRLNLNSIKHIFSKNLFSTNVPHVLWFDWRTLNVVHYKYHQFILSEAWQWHSSDTQWQILNSKYFYKCIILCFRPHTVHWNVYWKMPAWERYSPIMLWRLLVMKEKVTQCSTVAHWCVFVIFCEMMELYGREE